MDINMMSYYNAAGMYRQQAATNTTTEQFHTGSAMHSWYPGYHTHQGGQMAPAPTYPMQEEQIWHHAHHQPMFHNSDYHDFVAHPGMQQYQMAKHPQLPSPPMTVSESEISSPDGEGGSATPPQIRPTAIRSPFEWIKKTSHQTEQIPGKTRTRDKYRVVYTDHQRIELEKEFTFNNKYITILRKKELAENLGLSERQIKIWFQNRRAKERKQIKKRNEEKQNLEVDAPFQRQAPANHPTHVLGVENHFLSSHHLSEEEATTPVKLEQVWEKVRV